MSNNNLSEQQEGSKALIKKKKRGDPKLAPAMGQMLLKWADK